MKTVIPRVVACGPRPSNPDALIRAEGYVNLRIHSHDPYGLDAGFSLTIAEAKNLAALILRAAELAPTMPPEGLEQLESANGGAQ